MQKMHVLGAAAAGLILAAIAPAGAGPQFAVALDGYDAVAYRTAGAPMPGSNDHAHFWNGVNWLFVSDEHRRRFSADPQAYAPQYDGYCAYAAAKGYKAPGSPLHWRIVDGRLFVNFNGEAQDLWQRDVGGHIAAGDRNWPKLNTN